MFYLQILLSILVGAITGFINTTSGGGGLISLPYVLATGCNPVLALGTNKFQSTIGALSSIYYFRKSKIISFRYGMLAIIFAFIGACGGVYTVKNISHGFLEKIIPIMLLLFFIFFWFNKSFGLKQSIPKMKVELCFVIFGIILGFYDGFFGPGTGNFWVFALVGFAGFDFKKATLYSSLANAFSNLASFIIFTVYGLVNYEIALPMVVGQVIGSKLGSNFIVQNSSQIIRKLFLGAVFIVTCCMFYKYYF